MTRARIATVCQNEEYYPTIEENRAHILHLLDLALAQRPDLVCLPETFTTAGVLGPEANLAEPVPGPTTDLIAKRAREHHSYVICPIKTQRDGIHWNSAILIGRQGEIVGIYDKVHPVTTSADYTVMENGLRPGSDPPVFDLDFGRIGIQICFDAGFPETWQMLANKGARLIFWPSAYNGGFPLQVYAYLHHVYVVSSVAQESSRIIDPLGRILAATDPHVNVIVRDINPDFCVCHYDFNYSIPDLIMAQYGDRVTIRSDFDSGHFLVEPNDDAITIAHLQQEFGFESTGLYHQRHRDAYTLLREGKTSPPQTALHGNRPEYAKW
ncbi:MAG TPA: carbon-nitrogen hydrolase family protein [Anaerolineae bacterium]|nr:carbon-nitrogen hydrolase family protein [Anaerolineae bacterium]HQI84578.1 carbon-nitrogen hydrolase family protein [Anaerolineae bacterium]